MKKIKVKDNLQRDYVYSLSRPTAKDFDENFKPQLTPKEMLELGVFGGLYLADCQKEFPKDWFKNAKMAYKDVTLDAEHDKSLNFFEVNASQPLAVWQKKGWIHPQDPRGWFQWYCRYFMGRRTEDDDRQIKRWKAIGRHIAQVKKNCHTGNFNCRRKQRQTLLHWAIDSRNI